MLKLQFCKGAVLMKGQKTTFDKDTFAWALTYLKTVWIPNPFESYVFAAFWTLVEQAWAEQFKREWAYGSGFEQGCDCGSSTCDECNPGWDLVDDENFEEPDYGF